MTSIEERALSLNARILEVGKYRGHGELVAEVAKFRDGLDGHAEAIERVLRHRTDMSAAGLAPSVINCTDEVKEARTRQKGLERALLNPEIGPVAIDRADAKNLLDLGSALRRKAVAATTKEWEAHCKNVMPKSLSDDLPAASAPTHVRSAVADAVSALRSAASPDSWEEAGAVAALEAAVDSFEVAWAAFEPHITEMPPDVSAFVASVDAGTANLTHLTPEVLNWLQDKGEATRYEVRR